VMNRNRKQALFLCPFHYGMIERAAEQFWYNR
jgi:hypothetical protein